MNTLCLARMHFLLRRGIECAKIRFCSFAAHQHQNGACLDAHICDKHCCLHAVAGASGTVPAESSCSPLSDSPPPLRPLRARHPAACGHSAAPERLGALESALLHGPVAAGPPDDASRALLLAGPAETRLRAPAALGSPTSAGAPAGAPQCDAPPATGLMAQVEAPETLCGRAQGWRRVVCRLVPSRPPHFVAVSGGPGAGGGALLRARMGPLDIDGRSYDFDEVRMRLSKLCACCSAGVMCRCMSHVPHNPLGCG